MVPGTRGTKRVLSGAWGREVAQPRKKDRVCGFLK
jgi:hypothetical protein